MTHKSPSIPDDTRLSRTRVGSQHSYHRHSQHSQHRSPLRTSPKATHKTAHHSTQAHKSSPLIMVTTSNQTHRADDDVYSHFSLEDDAQLSQSYGWMQPIEIEDDDLMFGGKSLSAWYEEERQAPAAPVEEERRGRQRVSSCLNIISNLSGMALTITCRFAPIKPLRTITTQSRRRRFLHHRAATIRNTVK